MILDIVFRIIRIYSILILISILGSWIDPMRVSPIFNAVRKVTDPFLNLFRIIIPIGNLRLDISPIIAFMVLNLITRIISEIAYF